MTPNPIDSMPVWSWKRIRNLWSNRHPGPWIGYYMPGHSGAAALTHLHAYIGQERAEAVRQAVAAGHRKGKL